MSDPVSLKIVRWRQKELEPDWSCTQYFHFYSCLCLSSRRDVVCEENSCISWPPKILAFSILKQEKVTQQQNSEEILTTRNFLAIWENLVPKEGVVCLGFSTLTFTAPLRASVFFFAYDGVLMPLHRGACAPGGCRIKTHENFSIIKL